MNEEININYKLRRKKYPCKLKGGCRLKTHTDVYKYCYCYKYMRSSKKVNCTKSCKN